jgi:hypothetical protein
MRVFIVILAIVAVGIYAKNPASPFCGVTERTFQGNLTTVYYDKNGLVV